MDFNGLLDMGIHTTIGALGGYIGNRLAKPNMEEKLKLMSVMNESKALNQQKKMLFVSRAQLIDEMNELISHCQ